ncbi:MAG: RluA family pseudouridine synthase [Gammaproteobacteria bacterium]
MEDREHRAVRLVEIDASHEGQRIDNFLLAILKGVPKSHVYRLLRKGEVRVNKGRIKPVYRLKRGDVVRIPPVRTAEPAEQAAAGPALRARLEQAVRYEDEHLMVLDKPGGMAVHGGSGIRQGLIEVLRQMRPHLPELSLVHRLDRETSGCLLIAKQRPVLLALQAQFQSEDIGKHYLALLKGLWLEGERLVDLPLFKNRLQSGERVVRVEEGGRAAISVFTPRTLYHEASLVAVTIKTGRMHQIRVHAAALDHPVAGDVKYGDPEFNRRMKRLGLRRLFLHAARLEFMHPVTHDRVAVEAPLSADLAAVLERLADS